MTVQFRTWVSALVVVSALSFGTPLPAADKTSLLGSWTTIDDHTGKPKGVVRIYQEGGKYFGKLERSFKPGADLRRCEKCTDERKDQPVIGLLIIRDMSADGDEFSGGDILDPDNGSVYRCKLKVEDGGRKLRVRGYIGISWLGRTQVWERAD